MFDNGNTEGAVLMGATGGFTACKAGASCELAVRSTLTVATGGGDNRGARVSCILGAYRAGTGSRNKSR